MQAQTSPQPTPERLGYPAGTRLLIIHADDLALAHSVDQASFAALESHAATAASIMAPCPWLTEVAAWASEHPDADLGLHLTLNSEWKSYRWGPLASRNEVPRLLDPDGYLWSEVAPAVSHATPAEVEKELRAQIDRARTAGLRLTHLDSHMGTLFTPKFFPVYVKVARDYGVPFFAVRLPGFPKAMLDLLRDTDIVPDAVLIASPQVKPENWSEYYIGLVKSLKPGLTELIVHLGQDNAELQAITEGHPAFGSAWRQRDFDVVTSPEFRAALERNQVKVVGWKDLRAK